MWCRPTAVYVQAFDSSVRLYFVTVSAGLATDHPPLPPSPPLFLPFLRARLKERDRKARGTMGRGKEEAAWLSGQRAGLAILWSQIRVPLWLLAGFVLSCPELKSSATLLNSQLVASGQLVF